MNRLEELRRLLEAAFACGSSKGAEWDVLNDRFTWDDLAALLDVAEAANEALENAIPAPRYGECIIEHGALGIALAPLVEATDD